MNPLTRMDLEWFQGSINQTHKNDAAIEIAARLATLTPTHPSFQEQ
ncbi:MAG: hypothetical protein RL587_228 [Actinomycetota bacterium]